MGLKQPSRCRLTEGITLQRVLIIEDEPDMVLGLKDNFEYEGYDVTVARDGREGLTRALADRPDLILLDIMLPKMSGLDVCRELRNNGLDTPVIMLTARGQRLTKLSAWRWAPTITSLSRSAIKNCLPPCAHQ